MTEPADRELLDGIRAGRRDACARLIHEHYAAIYRFLFHLSRDAAEAEDLTQETFAAAWEKSAAFEGRSAFGTWLHRIAYGKFVDARRAGRRSAALAERLRAREPAESPSPVESAAQDDEARRLYAALERVDPADRLILVLHYLQGLSYREMADVTGEPVGTIKWRTSVALDRMRSLLTTEEPHVAWRAGRERA
ncbi:MAG TPA: sigma-70 family RNA polymerase sigma factor [Gemmataceae bacterium]|nr:sigma-70 family RNA polymerase sigma factor [Gemmataceae bacterium]